MVPGCHLCPGGVTGMVPEKDCEEDSLCPSLSSLLVIICCPCFSKVVCLFSPFIFISSLFLGICVFSILSLYKDVSSVGLAFTLITRL